MHWLVVLVVVLLVFGPSKLASVGKGLGEGIRNFKHGLGGDADKDDEERIGAHGSVPESKTPQKS